GRGAAAPVLHRIPPPGRTGGGDPRRFSGHDALGRVIRSSNPRAGDRANAQERSVFASSIAGASPWSPRGFDRIFGWKLSSSNPETVSSVKRGGREMAGEV